jgi:predicted DNA-binding protein (UPF0278 family)
MGVVLYDKEGNSKVADPYGFAAEVEAGKWFLSKETALLSEGIIEDSEPEVEEIVDEPELETTEIISDDDIRAMAKEAGIRNWHNKRIDRLKDELDLEA